MNNYDEIIKSANDTMIQLNQIILDLQERIDKSIEYMEDKLIDIDTHNVYGEIERLDLEEIKRILKGE